MSEIDRQAILEAFIFDTQQLLEELEQIVISAEDGYSMEQINATFRIMHTIKGTASMMLFNNISTAAHAIEDLFFYLREQNPKHVDYTTLADHVLESMDFLKDETAKISAGEEPDGNPGEIVKKITSFLTEVKEKNGHADKPKKQAAGKPSAQPSPSAGSHVYDAVVVFTEGSEMENVRAYTLVFNLKNMANNITYTPEDLIDEASIEVIRSEGFKLTITTDLDYDTIYNALASTIYAKDIYLEERVDPAAPLVIPEITPPALQAQEAVIENSVQQSAATPLAETTGTVGKKAPVQSMINVSVNKLDTLLKLVGELVITEAMVTQNPDLEGLVLENFTKEARQLHKIVQDLQSTVMSTRMMTLTGTFFKMNRIVRDMCKQLNKEVNLEIVGDDTEVDKNIIEHISDPIMHIIRNAVDHGVEMPEKRRKAGKPEKGTIVLEAKNIGTDVLITVQDDGGGLDRDRILEKAQNNGLLRKSPGEYSDKEIYQFIFLPGFSTNEAVTSYSGRGVGMDVVSKNLEIVGGTTTVDSTPGEGSIFTMKIPLTLAIRKGMIIEMGGAKYTIPIDSIKNSFKPARKDIFTDPDGNEMITVYGEHLNIVKLYEFFEMPEAARAVEDGIMMIVENDNAKVCLLIDELVGEQSVVVKNLPKYIKKIPGLSGCTLLGNGDISLIIDPAAFFDK